MTEETKLTVVVADPDNRVRSALILLLREQQGVTVVAESSDLAALLAQVRELKPDLVLLDWELPGRPAAALLLARSTLGYQPRVIVFSARPELEGDILAAGADAFVSKSDPPEALVKAVRKVAEEYRKGVIDQEE